MSLLNLEPKHTNRCFFTLATGLALPFTVIASAFCHDSKLTSRPRNGHLLRCPRNTVCAPLSLYNLRDYSQQSGLSRVPSHIAWNSGTYKGFLPKSRCRSSFSRSKCRCCGGCTFQTLCSPELCWYLQDAWLAYFPREVHSYWYCPIACSLVFSWLFPLTLQPASRQY